MSELSQTIAIVLLGIAVMLNSYSLLRMNRRRDDDE